jgi:hypothetical protein
MINRMLRDAEYFKVKVGALGDSGGAAGDHLVTLVKAKTVPKAKATTPAEASPKASTEKADGANEKSNGTVSPETNGRENPIEADEKKKDEKPS